MVINSKDIIVYSLNPEIYKSRAYYIEELRKLNIFKEVKRISFDYKMRDRVKTIIMAHLYAFISAIDKNDFPLLMLEDDARLFNKFPEIIDVPDECELLYVGGSTYCCGQIPNLYIKEYNKDFYRVFNMLSAHAILIPNKKGCRTITDAYIDAIYRGKFNDVVLGSISSSHIFLTPKDGMYFYQEGNVEKITKFMWKDKKEKYLKK